jgi:hypothetical protein
MSKRHASILALCFTALLMPHSLAAQYYACIYRLGLPAARNGQVFATQTSPLNNKDVEDVNTAWKAYIDSHHPGLNGEPICYVGAETVVNASRAAVKQNYRNGTITDIDWVYDAGMTALPSKAGAAYAFCTSGDYAGNTVYETPVFEIPMDDARSTNSPVEVTYAKYLEAHYKKTTPQRDWLTYSLACPHSAGNRAATEAHRAQAEQKLRAAGKNVVQTNWTYQRTADTPPANPRPTKIH